LRHELTHYRYLYMASPIHIDDDPNADWQGSIHALKESVKKNFRKLHYQMNKQAVLQNHEINNINIQLSKVFDQVEVN